MRSRWHGRSRWYEEDGQASNCRDGRLVDAELGGEAGQAARLVELSFIEPLERRLTAVFLGRGDCVKLEDRPCGLVADLLLECLGRFVRQRGGSVVAAFDADDFGARDPVVHSVKAGGKELHILKRGYLFALLPGARVAVAAAPADDEHVAITLWSDADAAGFMRKWQDFAKRDNYLRGRAFFADGEVIERSRRYSWEDIVVPGEVRETLATHVESFFRNRDALARHGVRLRRGLILSGAPGTGKTLLGKVLADTLGVSFVWVLPRHVQRPGSFKEILSLARMVAPCVLFLEDLDLFAQDREARNWLGLGELMNQLDGAMDNEDIVTIATTNRLAVIERALRNRPGRFDRTLVIPPLDELGCRALLGKRLAGIRLAPDDMDFLASATAGCTGAEVVEVANTLLLLAVQRAEAGGEGGDGRPLVLDRSILEASVVALQGRRRAGMGFGARQRA